MNNHYAIYIHMEESKQILFSTYFEFIQEKKCVPTIDTNIAIYIDVYNNNKRKTWPLKLE